MKIRVMQSDSGMTLAEILISAVISMVILFGLISMDIARVRTTDQTRYAAGVKYPERDEASIAVMLLERQLTEADRFNIVNGGQGIQLRRPLMTGACAVGVPAAACFDILANYQWDQFSVTAAGQFVLYTNIRPAGGCNNVTTLVQDDILQTAPATFAFSTVDPNVVTFSLVWQNPDDASDTMPFPGEVAVRGRTMGLLDNAPGVLTGGLQAPWAAEAPPAACP